MASLVLAAKTLIEQVQERKEGATYDLDEIDGFDRYRVVVFDPKTSTWLRPILEACADGRIKDLDDGPKKGSLLVRFVDTIEADTLEPFALDEADRVLNDNTQTN